MMSLKLTCSVITPMFMAGADGRTPELRSSEFKGMMRFWWRAIRAEDDIEKLKKEEAEIFGGSGEGQGKSKIGIRILTQLSNFDIFDYQPLPHHQRVNCPVDRQTNCRKSFPLKAVKPDKEIELSFKFMADEDNRVKSLIYLCFILGGFGKRSRRGFGSLEIIKPEKITVSLDNILCLLNNINKGKYEIAPSKVINDINSIINKNPTRSPYPWIKEIILSNKKFHNYNEILKAIGLASHKYSDPSLGFAHPRMTSPVYVSAVRDGDSFKPVITLLNSRFPDDYPKWNFNKQKDFIKELML